MKTSILHLALVALTCCSVQAQRFYNFNLYGGYSLQQTPKFTPIIVNRDIPIKEFQFGLTSNAPQYQVGLVKNFAFSKPFYGTLGIEYAQQNQTYAINMTYPQRGETMPAQYELNYSAKSISVPIGISVKMGILDVNSGLMARYNFQAKAEGDHMMDITSKPSNTEFGWHTGAGINVGPVRFGVEYQSTLTRDGANLQHRGKSLEMRSVPGQFSFRMGYSF